MIALFTSALSRRRGHGTGLRTAYAVVLLGILALAGALGSLNCPAASGDYQIFARTNLVAWCIVPFDAKARGPEERAAMLERLGFKLFAYDYRANHIPTFDAEMEALKRHHVRLLAWWFPWELNDEARLILGVLKFERMPFLAIIKEAKMRGFVSPGQVLTIEARLEHEGSGFAVTKAKGRIGKDLKCSAEITFGLAPFPDPTFRTHMDAMARKIGFPLQAVAQ